MIIAGKQRTDVQFFRPILAGAHLPERLIACLGAAICIGLTVVVCSGLPLATADFPIIVAPLGASAILVLAVPASPMAQPWPVIGGNIVSALIGVAAFNTVSNVALAAGIAVGLAILVMSILRCLHPPGGAAALTAVIGSQGVHAAGYSFAFAPVGINSIALVSLAMFFHRATARAYPHHPAEQPVTETSMGLHLEDIDAALEDMHENFDISRADLADLLTRAEAHSMARQVRSSG